MSPRVWLLLARLSLYGAACRRPAHLVCKHELDQLNLGKTPQSTVAWHCFPSTHWPKHRCLHFSARSRCNFHPRHSLWLCSRSAAIFAQAPGQRAGDGAARAWPSRDLLCRAARGLQQSGGELQRSGTLAALARRRGRAIATSGGAEATAEMCSRSGVARTGEPQAKRLRPSALVALAACLRPRCCPRWVLLLFPNGPCALWRAHLAGP